MADDEKPSRGIRGWITNAAAETIDVNGFIDAVDIDSIVERVDLDAVVERIDLDALVDRIDVNELVAKIDLDDILDRIDLNELVSRIDIDALVGRVDMNALLDRIDPDLLLDRIDPNRLLDRVDPDRLLDRVNPDQLLDRLDPNRLLDRVEPDRLLDRVDPNRLMDRVDADRIVARVDANALVRRVDANALVASVDANALVASVDVNAVADRLDIDRLVDRMDVAAIVERAGVPEIVRESTGHMAGSLLDVARRQVVAIDQVVTRIAGRFVRGKTKNRTLPQGPPLLVQTEATSSTGRGVITGHYAGPLSRLLGFALDVAIIFTAFTLTSSLLLYLSGVIFDWSGDLNVQQTLAGFFLLCAWAFTYSVGGLIIAGRTVGKGVVGLRVVKRSGAPMTGGQAVVRTAFMPLAIVTFLVSYIGLFIGAERRSLPDAVAGTAVVYDWGDRPAEMSAPLTQWINANSE